MVVHVAGPAVGAPVGLGPGRHLVGRARGAAVRLADPDVEPHHAVLDVGLDGAVTILQLAGRVPVIVGDVPVDGTTPLRHHVTIELGASRVLVAAPTPEHDGHRDRRVSGRSVAASGAARTSSRYSRAVTAAMPPPPPTGSAVADGE